MTEDGIFHGGLQLRQHRRGYRFTEDAVLLARFACRGEPAGLAADLGAGCAVVGLMVLYWGGARRMMAVELQAGLARLANDNASRNGMHESLVTLRADLRALPLARGCLDLIVSNPPYLTVGAGMAPPNRERALARHEIACSPEALACEAARCLAPHGRLALIYPARRSAQVLTACAEAGLSPSRTRLVHPRPGVAPSLILVEAVNDRGSAAMIEETALVTRDEAGDLTEEMSGMLGGGC